MTTIDRWKNWKPKPQTLADPTSDVPSGDPSVASPGPQKFADSPDSEPTKTTKTLLEGHEGVSVVFDGSTSGHSQKILAPNPEVPTEPERAAANAVLGRAGVRLMTLPEGVCVGIWSDLDAPEVRAVLRIFGSDTLPVRYLDSDVPMRYKLRRVKGEPVPMTVLAEMERHPEEPWKVRDQMLKQMSWRPKGIPWRG